MTHIQATRLNFKIEICRERIWVIGDCPVRAMLLAWGRTLCEAIITININQNTQNRLNNKIRPPL